MTSNNSLFLLSQQQHAIGKATPTKKTLQKQQAILAAAMAQTIANGSQPCSSQQSIASYLSSENARGGNLDDKRSKKRQRKQDKTKKMPSKLTMP